MAVKKRETVAELRAWYVQIVATTEPYHKTIEAHNPSTGAVIGSIPVCSPATVAELARRARIAQSTWAETTVVTSIASPGCQTPITGMYGGRYKIQTNPP